jgi:hypothetical protein
MKLKLTAATLALAALSSLAHAQAQNPQPSFNDSAPVDAAGYAPGDPAIQREFPRPSFDDAPVAVAENVVTSFETRPAAQALAAFPQPSSVAN